MTVIEFTDAMKHSYSAFSPDGAYIMSALQHRILVRDVSTLTVEHAFAIMDSIGSLKWAPNSYQAALLNTDRTVIYLVARDADTLLAKFSFAPMIKVETLQWSPDGRYLLVFLDHELMIMVFDMAEKKFVANLGNPKFNSSKGCSFRLDGNYFMYLARESAKDWIYIYDCEKDWQLAKKFEVNQLRDAENAIWSPDGKSIFLFESLLTYKFVVYSPDGRCLATFTPFDPEKEMEEFSLGVKGAAWSPSSQFVAVGGYDHSLRLVNGYTWKTTLEWNVPGKLEPTADLLLYREKLVPSSIDKNEINNMAGAVRKTFASKPLKETHSVQFELCLKPITLTFAKQDDRNPNKFGITLLTFNCDGTLLAFRDDAIPQYLFIYSLLQARLTCVLELISPVRQLVWHPTIPDHLWFVSSPNTSFFYYWTLQGANVIDIQPLNSPFSCRDLECHPKNANAVMIKDKTGFCVGYVSD